MTKTWSNNVSEMLFNIAPKDHILTSAVGKELHNIYAVASYQHKKGRGKWSIIQFDKDNHKIMRIY